MSELKRWKVLWSKVRESTRPRSVMATLAYENVTAEYYPDIRELLIILVVLPVSVASCEWPFHTLKRLNTYLRSCTGQDRLVWLALSNIHFSVEVTPGRDYGIVHVG